MVVIAVLLLLCKPPRVFDSSDDPGDQHRVRAILDSLACLECRLGFSVLPESRLVRPRTRSCGQGLQGVSRCRITRMWFKEVGGPENKGYLILGAL